MTDSYKPLSELAAFPKFDLGPADELWFDVSQHTPHVVFTGMGARAWDIGMEDKRPRL